MDRKQNETDKQMGLIFSQVREAKIQAPPYIKTRVLAHLREKEQVDRKLFFWRLFSAGSVAFVLALSVINLKVYYKSESKAATEQAYVIHVDFNQNDQAMVAKAEVELPSDVHFVSSNKDLVAQKKMTLPVSIKSLGRGKLPFVVASNSTGEKHIIIRLLNEKDELIREQVMKFKFAKQDGTVSF